MRILYNKSSDCYSIRYKDECGIYITRKFTNLRDAEIFRDELINKPKLDLENFTWQERLINTLLSEKPQSEREKLDYDALDEIIISNLETAISNLTPREEQILKFYYSGNTLEKCGKEFGITKERARQIIRKALKRLYYRRFVIFTYNDFTAIDNAIKIEHQKKLEELHLLQTMSLDEYVIQHDQLIKSNKKIEDLDLSVRSYNCLNRAGIYTVEELTQKTEEEMMKVRNLGRKSLKEIKEKLNSLGLKFKEMEFDFEEDEGEEDLF